MFRRYLVIALCLLVVLPALSVRQVNPTRAQEDLSVPRYFDTTGFWVQGSFREYWESHGGLSTFGYPITSVFQDADGLEKQYFERAIFEYHPENEGTQYEVLLQRLGAIRVAGREGEEPFQRLEGIQPDDNCDYYQETGHRLCFGFKTYWNEHGGLANFGFPISEEFDEANAEPPAGDGNTYTVQYFERTRFEYHPEYQGTEYEVLLGLLGTEYLLKNGAPDYALERQSPEFPPADVTNGGPLYRYGFNIAWRGDDSGAEFNSQTLGTVEDVGFNSVRIQVSWAALEPQPGQYDFRSIDRLVSEAEQHGIDVLVSIVQAPTWATEDGSSGIPSDAAPFGRMMEALARQFDGRMGAYEIWNEQNLARETGGTIDIGRYVNLLKAGYTGVKSGSPNARVVFGGLTPTGVDDPALAVNDVLYLQRIYEYNDGEVKNYYDVLGAHPGSNNNPPDTSWPDNPGPDGWSDDNSFYFRRIQDLRSVMVANDEGEKPIWLTEFGWSLANQAPGYEYGEQNSPEQQADYLVRAISNARTEWPWVHGMYIWNLNFATVVDAQDEKGPWSVLNPDGSQRPAIDALRQMPKIR